MSTCSARPMGAESTSAGFDSLRVMYELGDGQGVDRL
jgi:hypothetical protein